MSKTQDSNAATPASTAGIPLNQCQPPHIKVEADDWPAPAEDLEPPEEPFDFAAYNRLGHPMFNHAVKRSDYDALRREGEKR